MGIAKWFLKNGFGSPGHTAKIWTKRYLLASKGTPIDEIFEQLIFSFHYGQSSVGNLTEQTKVSTIIEHSEQCLATLIFILLCDTKGFVKNICFSSENFSLVTDVIYETVKELAPNSVQFSPENFKRKTYLYLLRKIPL